MPSPRLPPSTICSAEAPRIVDRGHPHVARAAHDGGQRIDEPDDDRPGQCDAGIDERLLEHRALSAEHREDAAPEGDEQHREDEARHGADRQRMQRQRSGPGIVAGAERAADRRGHAAAHGARRQHLHQHHHGEYQGDGGKLGGAEHADIDRLGDRHGGHHQHGREIWQRQPQQGRQYRRVEQRVGGADRGAAAVPPRAITWVMSVLPSGPGRVGVERTVPCRPQAVGQTARTGHGKLPGERTPASQL